MANRRLGISDAANLSTFPRTNGQMLNEVKTVLGLPLMAAGGPIGSLLIYSNEWEAFDEKETELLQQAANDNTKAWSSRARIARVSVLKKR